MILPSASQLLHAHLGSPPVAECAPIPFESSCWICGGTACPRGIDARLFCQKAMTDQTQCRDQDASHVCEACIYVRARSSPVPERLPGPCSACRGKHSEGCSKCGGSGRNAAGGNFRNYTHLFDEGADPRYVTASKAEKPVILAWLREAREGAWFAAIADSGQKQVLPYAPINLPWGRGRVVFDDVTVLLPTREGWGLADAMSALLTTGVTKDEVGSGLYLPSSWRQYETALRAFEERWGHERRGSWFSLALWLAQRDEAALAAGKETHGDQRRSRRGAPPKDRRGAAHTPKPPPRWRG